MTRAEKVCGAIAVAVWGLIAVTLVPALVYVLTVGVYHELTDGGSQSQLPAGCYWAGTYGDPASWDVKCPDEETP